MVEAGHLGGLAADQRAVGLPAARRNAGDHGRTVLRIELAAGEVVEEEQRLGALHHEVVDRHGDEIDADGAVVAGVDRDLDLGADAVGRGDQDRVAESGALEVEQPAEAADLGIGARARRRPHQRLDQVDHGVAGIDVDARLGVGQAGAALVVHVAGSRRKVRGRGAVSAAWYGRIGCGAMAGLRGRTLASARGRLHFAAGRHLWRMFLSAEPLRRNMRGAAAEPGPVLNLPNLITVARILMVPVVVWAIASRQMQIAFLLFLAAGVSDAVDGFLAKRFGMASELGAHLDPLADKALIVSIYVALGITDAIPRWVVILVVSRDILIVGGVMFAWFLDKPMLVKPLLVSKLNTAAQIVFASLVLASLAFGFAGPAEQIAQAALMWLVAALTLLSVGFYTREWWRHMNAGEAVR